MNAHRRRLVRTLAEGGVLCRPGLAEAFEAVPREVFLPGVPLEQVYADEAVVVRTDPSGIPISSSSQPSVMALMLAQLDPRPGERVLEVGTGTGYNAALLERLVAPDGRVVTIDLDEDITAAARRRLRDAGAGRVSVRTGDGWLGSPQDAPFEKIELTVGVWDLSPAWLRQLREGGTLVAPLWLGTGLQISFGLARRGETLVSGSAQRCGFQRLRGPHAGPEGYVPVTSTLLATLEDTSAGTVAALRELLAGAPEARPAPAAPEGWFARLALDERTAVQLTDLSDPDPAHGMAGLFDLAGEPSLALVQGDRLLRYGAPRAAERLARHLRHSEPLDVERLRLVARFGGRHPDPPAAGWRLRRPSCVLDVATGGGDGSPR